MIRRASTSRRLRFAFAYTLSILVILLTALAAGVSTAQAGPRFASGDLDPAFDGDGRLTTAFPGGEWARATTVLIQSNGKILAAGSVRPSTGDGNIAVARYGPTGALDVTFSGDGKVAVNLGRVNDVANAIAIHPATGKIVLVGQTCPADWDPCDAGVVRLTSGGSLDPTFSGDGKRIDNYGGGDNVFFAGAVYADGRIVAAGYLFNTDTMSSDFAILRYTVSGALDTTFSSDGKAAIDFGSGRVDVARAVAIQSDGRILVGGYSCDGSNSSCNFALARLNANGSLDATFSGDGRQMADLGGNDYAYGMALQSNGKVVLAGEKFAGSTTYFALARFMPAGGLDPNFSGDGKLVTNFSGDAYADEASAVALQADGKILVGGYVSSVSDNNFALARFTSSGVLDSSFGVGGKVSVNFGRNDFCRALAVQADGRIVLAGNNYSLAGSDFALARLLP